MVFLWRLEVCLALAINLSLINFITSQLNVVLFGRRVDCSQSPYFSVGFSRPVRFDGAATILVCKIERDLGRVSKLPRGGERSWEVAGKIGRL